MKEWRSGQQREINNRAKCEDHGHSFQQTLLKTVRVRGGERDWDQGRLRSGIGVGLSTLILDVHEISRRHRRLLCAAFEMHWVTHVKEPSAPD